MAASDSLKWTAQFTVTPPTRTRKLPGDKILLPPSALEQLLAAAPIISSSPETSQSLTPQFDPFNPHTFAAERRARELAADRQQQLPQPLTFRIVNTQNGRIVHAGIREFSAQENEVVMSPFLRQSLGFDDRDFQPRSDTASRKTDEIAEGESQDIQDEVMEEGYQFPTVTVHAKQLPKGTYVRLRPLEAGYDPEDWKALLERYLRENFTTLTINEILAVPGDHNETFRFLVDKVQPEGDGICIVDTDLEVDIEPLNEEQARETLKRRLEKASSAPGTKDGSSTGGKLSVGQEVNGQVLRGEYVDYEMQDWNQEQALDIELDIADDADIDLFVSPFSDRQRARPREDEHVFGDFSSHSPKRLRLQPTNIELQDISSLYISIHANSHYPRESGVSADGKGTPMIFRLRAINVPLTEAVATNDAEVQEEHDSEDTQCKNCQQGVPKRTLFLHENFCLRNNVVCPKCKNVFQKRSPEWESHWHCPHDNAYGNDTASRSKHDSVFHLQRTCSTCNYEASNLPDLAHHRTTICPGKIILCRFCHLAVPQQGESDPDMMDPEVLLSGLSPHELVDGGRTTECHLCGKIIRLRDMTTHLKHHDLDRLSRPSPRICINPNCGRTLPRKSGSSGNDSLGLCTVCFGPLYADVYDPEGKALRRRIERRYLSQLLSGCGKAWCGNEYCKTGRANAGIGKGTALSSKDAFTLVKPLMGDIAVGPHEMNAAPLYFCTDEQSQQRRKLAEMLAVDEQGSGGYGIPWCVAAVEAAAGDVSKATDWLKNWAPKNAERSR
ncbi:hypothetical protein AJ80_06211 [Polytolypa hystricis UAMH7299]|uniref:Uncharacterized protein n=1 Tax=Polytolypa hystricis (strain UAMH7299) TaxID=1447883 RepID=A0A2B7XWW5_POLH7|nr:hypothetical protein AJ80_06211 [Polytolypa hystricis UAMH7299]